MLYSYFIFFTRGLTMRLLNVFMVLFFMINAIGLSAQAAMTLPKIGVVDVNRVYRETNKSSAAVAKIDAAKEKINTDVRKRKEDIKLLEEKLAIATAEANDLDIEMYTSQISLKKQELERYWNTANEQLKIMADSVKVDQKFMDIIHKAIVDVSNRGGYSIVLASNQTLLYWSIKVDITSEVVAYINKAMNGEE